MNATVFLGLFLGLVGLGLVLRRRAAADADLEVADADLEEVADADLEEVADADLEEVADADLGAVRAPPMPSAESIMALRHRLACTRRNRFTIDAQVGGDDADPEICGRCLQVNPDILYVAGNPIQVLGCNSCMRDPQEVRRG